MLTDAPCLVRRSVKISFLKGLADRSFGAFQQLRAREG